MLKHIIFFAAVFLAGTSSLRAQLKVSVIAVGQGDSTFIELPSGENVLIDGGPLADTAYEFLKAKGVTQIDHVVLTHPHSDHYVGLKKIFSSMKVRNFYDSRAENLEAGGDGDLRAMAAAEPGCRTRFPKSGDKLEWDPKVTVKVLNTCYEALESRDNNTINDCSIALRFYYNGNGLLFMGDADASTEEAMRRAFKSGLKSSVLKVSHHGSRYASTADFLSRIRPKYAFISFGVDNPNGHPHIEAIERLQAGGTKVLYTANGTYSFSISAMGKGHFFPGRIRFHEHDADDGTKTGEPHINWTPNMSFGSAASPAAAQLTGYAIKGVAFQ